MAMKKPLLVLRCMKKLIRCGCCPTVTHITLVRCLVYCTLWLMQSMTCSRETATSWSESACTSGWNLCLKENLLWSSTLPLSNDGRPTWVRTYSIILGSEVLPRLFRIASIIGSQKPIHTIRINIAIPRLTSQAVLQRGDHDQRPMLNILLNTPSGVLRRDYWRNQGTYRLIQGKLCERVGNRTSYFGNWRNDVEKLPETTWTMWWLSEDDRLREEKDLREHEQKENMNKGEGSQAKKSWYVWFAGYYIV